MHDVVLQQAVLWIWLILAVAAILFAGFFFVKFLFDGESQEAPALSIVQLALQTAVGMAFLALLCLGHPASASWTWRILSCAMAAAGVGIVIRVRVDTPISGWKVSGELAFAGSTLVAVFFAIASFFVRASLPAAPAGEQPSGLAVIVRWLTADHVNKLASAIALFLLAVLTVYAAFCFLRAVQRRGTLSIERNDAGIGGSSSVWEISPALTFLAAMLLFGSLFSVLLFHEETRVTGEQNRMTEQARTPNLPSAPTPSVTPSISSPIPTTHTSPAEAAPSSTQSPSKVTAGKPGSGL